jgi:hypothetical protein
VHALGPRPLGQVFDDAGGHAARDAHRVDQLLRIQAQRRADAGRRADRTEHRGRMEARLVHEFRRDQAHAADHLGAHGEPAAQVGTRQAMALRRRQQGGHHHRARMRRTALEGVVVVLAVGRRAVAQRRHGDVARLPMADHGALARVVARLHRGAHEVGVARRDAEAGDVHQQRPADLPHRGRRAPGQCGDPLRQPFGHRDFWKCGAHVVCSSSAARRRRGPRISCQLE